VTAAWRSITGRRRHVAGAVMLAVLTGIFAAARSFDVTASESGFVGEVGGCLSAGLLVLVASRASAVAGRIKTSRPGASRRRVFLARGALGITLEAALAVLLSLPVLVVVWEFGTGFAEMGRLGLSLVAASACGLVLGGLAAGAGLTAPVAAVLATSLGALVLWPASLGWVSRAARFPAVETPVVAVAAIVLLAGLIGAVAVARRPRRQAA
jgi:hypothetical protein